MLIDGTIDPIAGPWKISEARSPSGASRMQSPELFTQKAIAN